MVQQFILLFYKGLPLFLLFDLGTGTVRNRHLMFRVHLIKEKKKEIMELCRQIRQVLCAYRYRTYVLRVHAMHTKIDVAIFGSHKGTYSEYRFRVRIRVFQARSESSSIK